MKDDLVGKRFGNYTVISNAISYGAGKHKKFLCRCDCGRETYIDRWGLEHGKRTHCRSCAKRMAFPDLTGQRFGVLTVLGRCPPPKYYADQASTYYMVRCDCGNEFPAVGSHLRRGIRYSCGCTRRKRVKGGS